MTSSRGSSQPRAWTWVSCIAGGFFYCWATGEDPMQSTIVQSHSCVQPFATSQTATRHACLSLITSWSLPKFMSITSVIPSSHLILWCPLLLLPSIFASIRDFFPKSWLFTSGDQNTGASASASVLPMSIQGWFPWRLTGLISLLSKGLSVVFFRTTVWRHQTLPCLHTFCMWLYWLTTCMRPLGTIGLTIWTFLSWVMSLLFNTLSRFVITFLPRSNHLLISWLQSPSMQSTGRGKHFLGFIQRTDDYNCYY